MRDSRDSFLGSGLPAGLFALVVLSSTLAFVFWGGPLWSVPREVGHGGRFVGSYSLLIPLAALALLAVKRLSWRRFLATLGLSFSIKLLITSSLYAVAAPGLKSRYSPAAAHTPAVAKNARARAAETTVGPTGIVRGRVERGGMPVSGAVIYAVSAAGATQPTAGTVVLTIGGRGYERAVYAASRADRLELRNTTAALHTLVLQIGPRSVRNTPLPPGRPAANVAAPPAGLYTLRCANHRGEEASLLILDHSPWSYTSDTGGFEIVGVPLGDVRVVTVLEGRETIERSVQLTAQSELVIVIEAETT